MEEEIITGGCGRREGNRTVGEWVRWRRWKIELTEKKKTEGYSCLSGKRFCLKFEIRDSKGDQTRERGGGGKEREG